jgi:galactokinase
MALEQLCHRVAQRFVTCFDEPAALIAAAPGRVNLIGEHTDYNDGFVMPMAIERHTVIAGSPTTEPQAILHSTTTGDTVAVNLQEPPKRGTPGFANYIRGVIAGFQELNVPLSGFSAVVDSDIPLGCGLSSSAALEVALATFLEALTGHRLDPIQKALLCQKAENDFAGMPCGIMDQFSSVLARKDHLLLLDCRSHETTPTPLNDPALAVLIVNTNVPRKLVDGEYAQRRAQCEEAARELEVRALRDATLDGLETAADRMDSLIWRRARHVITENARTLEVARLLARNEWDAVGELMYASHASLRDDYEVSCPALDVVVEIARKIGPADGVLGCRMTGGGFGGCAVALVRTTAVDSISRRISEAYEHAINLKPILFLSRPTAGAAILRPVA